MADIPMNISTDILKKYTILIVDDEPSIVEELASILKLEGYRVAVALSGEQGLLQLTEQPAELVIADQKMAGGMSGTEFLTLVKKKHPFAVTMILSAFSEPSYLLDAVNKAQVYQYILKPWNQSDLLLRINQSLAFYHIQAENRRLANANRQLLKKMAQMETYSLIGDFSTALYDRFFPVLHANLLAKNPEWGHLGTIVSRLGQVGAHYHLPPRRQLGSVERLVKACVAEAKGSTETTGVIWRESYQEGLPQAMLQEGTLIYAIKALIENAVIHGTNSPDAANKEISVSVYLREKDDKAIVIDVHDNGATPLDEAVIFAPLYSTQAQYSAPWVRASEFGSYNFSSYNHVGLGLPIARWCASQHEGSVELVRDHGPGVLFRITVSVG